MSVSLSVSVSVSVSVYGRDEDGWLAERSSGRRMMGKEV